MNMRICGGDVNELKIVERHGRSWKENDVYK